MERYERCQQTPQRAWTLCSPEHRERHENPVISGISNDVAGAEIMLPFITCHEPAPRWGADVALGPRPGERRDRRGACPGGASAAALADRAVAGDGSVAHRRRAGRAG